MFPASTSSSSSSRTLDSSTFLVRNTPAARAFLLEWWAAAAAGVGGGCLPFDGAALHLVLLRRLDRLHRNQLAVQDATQRLSASLRPVHHADRASQARSSGRGTGDGDLLGTTALTGPWGLVIITLATCFVVPLSTNACALRLLTVPTLSS